MNSIGILFHLATKSHPKQQAKVVPKIKEKLTSTVGSQDHCIVLASGDGNKIFNNHNSEHKTFQAFNICSLNCDYLIAM